MYIARKLRKFRILCEFPRLIPRIPIIKYSAHTRREKELRSAALYYLRKSGKSACAHVRSESHRHMRELTLRAHTHTRGAHHKFQLERGSSSMSSSSSSILASTKPKSTSYRRLPLLRRPADGSSVARSPSTSSASLVACTSLTSSSARLSDRRRDLRRGASPPTGLCCRTARTGGVGPLEEPRARRVEAGPRDDLGDLSDT